MLLSAHDNLLQIPAEFQLYRNARRAGRGIMKFACREAWESAGCGVAGRKRSVRSTSTVIGSLPAPAAGPAHGEANGPHSEVALEGPRCPAEPRIRAASLTLA